MNNLWCLAGASQTSWVSLCALNLQRATEVEKLLGQEDPPQVTQHVLEIHPTVFILEEDRQSQSIRLWMAATASGVQDDSRVRALLGLFVSVKALLFTSVMGSVSNLERPSQVGISNVRNV